MTTDNIPATLQPGSTLPNGATVIASRREANKLSFVVLALRTGGVYDPYTVWVSDAQGITFSGHYFSDILAAAACFDIR